jgi:hypothetical protein
MDIFDVIKKGRKRNDKWQDKFLEAFAEEGNLQAAADAANITRQTVYNRLHDDPAFREKHDEAQARFCASIEREIKRRGFAGSDMLLMAMANRHMPNEYRQNQKVDTTITHDYVIKIGTPRVPAITEANTDTLQDVGTRRVYQSTGDVLE